MKFKTRKSGDMAWADIFQKPKVHCDTSDIDKYKPMYDIVCDIRSDKDASFVKLNIKKMSKLYIGDWTCTDKYGSDDEKWVFLNITQNPGGIVCFIMFLFLFLFVLFLFGCLLLFVCVCVCVGGGGGVVVAVFVFL